MTVGNTAFATGWASPEFIQEKDAEASAYVTKADALQIKAIREQEREADFVASTGVVDSHDEIVDQLSWDLSHYESNPVALYAHQSYELPIGQCTRVGVINGRLECTIRFSESTQRAREVWDLVKERTLRAVSVGFKPRNGKYEIRDGREIWVWSNCLLKEISVVPIGANHEALAKMKAALLAESSATKNHPAPAQPGAPVTNETGITITPTPSARAEETTMAEITKAQLDEATQAKDKAVGETALANSKAAEFEAKMLAAQKDVRDLEAKLKALETSNAAHEAQNKTLATERDAANERAEKAEAVVIDLEVEALVGKKITPAEKPLFVDLRKADKSLFTKMVEQRQPMKLEEQVIKADPKASNGALNSGSNSALAADFRKRIGL